MWAFAMSIVLATVGGGAALLPAGYGVLEGLVTFFGASTVGAALKTTPEGRLRMVRQALVVQNLSVAVSAVAGVTALVLGQAVESGSRGVGLDAAQVLAVGVLVVGGCSSAVSGLASSLAVEKDWVVVICGEDEDRLSRMNSSMRRIDLFCKTAAPVATGFLMALGVQWGAAAVALWNVVSLAFEYRLLELVAAGVAGLGGVEAGKGDGAPAASETVAVVPAAAGAAGAAAPAASALPAAPPRRSMLYHATRPLRDLSSGWQEYRQLPFFGSAIGLALLYVSLLSFNGVTTTFLLWAGVETWGIGLAQAAGAVCGLSATLAVPSLMRRLGLRGTASLAIWSQLLLLLPALAVLTVASSTDVAGAPPPQPPWASSVAGVVMLCTSLALSRAALWTFDLAVSQMLQSWVSGESRTTLNGVQKALHALLGVFGLLFALAVSSPAAFGWLALGSTGVVASAGVSHTFFSKASASVGFVQLSTSPAATPAATSMVPGAAMPEGGVELAAADGPKLVPGEPAI